MSKRSFRAVATGLCLALGLAGASHAQKDEDPTQKRIDGLEKQVKQLRSIVTQARDTGQPVQVRVSTDPDPVLAGLQTRLDDLEQAARQRNDQIDTLTRDLASARKDAADARSQAQSLSDRLDKVEARLKGLDDSVAASAAAAQAAIPAPPPPTTGGRAAAAQPAGPRAAAAPAPVANTPEAQDAFKKAKQLLLEGQYAQASRAFQAYVDTYGETPNAPEARYWMGETLYIRGLYSDAAIAYIGAIRGWPQTGWAPDAMVKLSRALVQLNKPQDACRALDDFTKRYPGASAAVKAKAADTRLSAMCA